MNNNNFLIASSLACLYYNLRGEKYNFAVSSDRHKALRNFKGSKNIDSEVLDKAKKIYLEKLEIEIETLTNDKK